MYEENFILLFVKLKNGIIFKSLQGSIRTFQETLLAFTKSKKTFIFKGIS